MYTERQSAASSVEIARIGEAAWMVEALWSIGGLGRVFEEALVGSMTDGVVDRDLECAAKDGEEGMDEGVCADSGVRKASSMSRAGAGAPSSVRALWSPADLCPWAWAVRLA